jgi:hypothetical protein
MPQGTASGIAVSLAGLLLAARSLMSYSGEDDEA